MFTKLYAGLQKIMLTMKTTKKKRNGVTKKMVFTASMWTTAIKIKMVLHNAMWDAIIWSGIAAGGWLFGYLICVTFNIGSFAR